jgi:aspartyl protease family protein
MLGWLLALLAVLVGAFFFLASGEPGELAGSLDGSAIVYLIVGGALVALYSVSLAGDYRGRAGKSLHHAAIWIGVLIALLGGYAFRGEIGTVVYRIAGEVMPPGEVMTVQDGQAGERAVRIRKHPSGHFVARATVNGSAIRLLVDTGASTVVLKPADAEKAGIDIRSLSFSVPVSTANGTTYAAPVRIRSLAVGPIVMEDVDALVSQPGSLKESLLGMSFLKRLRSYEVSGEFMTLRG